MLHVRTPATRETDGQSGANLCRCCAWFSEAFRRLTPTVDRTDLGMLRERPALGTDDPSDWLLFASDTTPHSELVEKLRDARARRLPAVYFRGQTIRVSASRWPVASVRLLPSQRRARRGRRSRRVRRIRRGPGAVTNSGDAPPRFRGSRAGQPGKRWASTEGVHAHL